LHRATGEKALGKPVGVAVNPTTPTCMKFWSRPSTLVLDTIISSARRDNPNLRDALADELHLFREIQRRTPELLTVEWIDLFKALGLEYATRCEIRPLRARSTPAAGSWI
jgi:hypothetical protein